MTLLAELHEAHRIRRATWDRRADQHRAEKRTPLIDLSLAWQRPLPKYGDQKCWFCRPPHLDWKTVARQTGLGAVCAYYDIPVDRLCSDVRLAYITRARWMAMIIMFEDFNLTNSEIGRRIGKDHTSVLYGVKRARALLATDETWRRDLAAIRAMVGK